MTSKPPNLSRESETSEEELFNEHPEIKVFFDTMDRAMAKFSTSMEDGAGLSEGNRLAHAWNCLIGFVRDFDEAETNLGLKDDDQLSLEQKILSEVDRHGPRPLSLGEERAIRVAAFYQAGLRPSFVGPKDTPMEAALQTAAAVEGLSPETGPETIRKSIQRFRKSIAGEEMLKLDRATLEWEVHKAEDVLLKGLPNRPGRPRKSGNSRELS